MSARGGLSYDKQTKVIYSGGEDVIIGTRSELNLFPGLKAQKDLFKALGIVVKSKGNPFTRNTTLVVGDYFRMQGDRFMQRNKHQGLTSSSWYGESGPAERSGSLRIGDSLYAINGMVIVNKSKGHVQRTVQHAIEKAQYPLVLIWRHRTGVNQIAWEDEECLPPPQGQFYQHDDEFGVSLHQPSVAI